MASTPASQPAVLLPAERRLIPARKAPSLALKEKTMGRLSSSAQATPTLPAERPGKPQQRAPARQVCFRSLLGGQEDLQPAALRLRAQAFPVRPVPPSLGRRA